MKHLYSEELLITKLCLVGERATLGESVVTQSRLFFFNVPVGWGTNQVATLLDFCECLP